MSSPTSTLPLCHNTLIYAFKFVPLMELVNFCGNPSKFIKDKLASV